MLSRSEVLKQGAYVFASAFALRKAQGGTVHLPELKTAGGIEVSDGSTSRIYGLWDSEGE